MCELLVGLPGVDVLGVAAPAQGWLIVHMAAREQRPAFRKFRHYRIRSLLYAGRPDWNLLATVTPR